MDLNFFDLVSKVVWYTEYFKQRDVIVEPALPVEFEEKVMRQFGSQIIEYVDSIKSKTSEKSKDGDDFSIARWVIVMLADWLENL